MKKYYALLLLFAAAMANAQTVNIPDANFKSKLISATLSNSVAKNAAGLDMIIDTNANGQIEVAEALNVYQLSVPNSSISTMQGIAAFTNLTLLNCESNALTALDLSANVNLKTIRCSFNNIAVLNTNGLTAVEELSAHGNNLTGIDVSNMPSLQILGLSSNNLTTLDCSNNHALVALYFSSNNLQTLFIKNGSDESSEIDPGSWWEGWMNNPSLTYVCADENEVASIMAIAADTVMVSSYCTFTPGGNYNTIAGTQLYDIDNNGCGGNDVAQLYMKITVNDGINSGSTFTDSSGNYKFYTQAGNFTLTPQLENPAYFNVNPVSSTINFATVNNSVATQNYCLTPNGNHQDLEIVLAPVVPARPGFDAVYKLVYRNKGNQVMAMEYGIAFFYNQNAMSFVSSSVTPSTIGPGGITWDYANLKPFETRTILVTMHINPPTDPVNPVNIDDVFNFFSTISPIGTDEAMADNYGNFVQTVVGSFDPNDIECIEGNVVAPTEIGNYLHYMIRFENTGTAAAENIVVKTEINPADFDIESLRLLSASHQVEARVNGNTVEFIFKNILLDSGGHGNILLKIKSKANLAVGDAVNKMANIFFDYNFPVATNNAQTAFENLSVGTIKDDSLTVYPNPASDRFTINANQDIKSVQFFDVHGRLLMTRIIYQKQTEVNVAQYPAGIYFLKVQSARGATLRKIVKQ